MHFSSKRDETQACYRRSCRANLAESHGIVVRFVGIADTVALKKPK